MKRQRILVAFDGSEESFWALEQAADAVQTGGGELGIVTVLPHVSESRDVVAVVPQLMEAPTQALRYLRDRWADALTAENPRVSVLTERGPGKGGAIGLISVEGMEPGALGSWLMRNYRIVNTPIVHPEFSGIRITPNIYTTLDEIDTFVDAVRVALRRGIA